MNTTSKEKGFLNFYLRIEAKKGMIFELRKNNLFFKFVKNKKIISYNNSAAHELKNEWMFFWCYEKLKLLGLF